MPDLADEITFLFEQGASASKQQARDAFTRLRGELSAGRVRSAEPDPSSPTGWRVNAWVKQGILLGLRWGDIVDVGVGKGRWPFFDKDTLPLKPLNVSSRVRVIPGGSSIRDGAYLGTGVICAPPMYINVGAYVDDFSFVDSHALVGSCAQIGKNVHLSAAAQIGGVLEPVGAMPVIVEDEALVGGNCGVYEGTIIGRRAVLGSGVLLTASVTVYDLVRETTYRRTADQPLRVPEGAVVVPGSRAAAGGFAEKYGLALYTPVIVKYRDEKTDAAAALEEALR